MLRVEQLSHVFKNGSEVNPVLHNISFHVKEGEMVALTGSSGSGKSTMLNLMAGLMKPTEGNIFINDKNIVKMGENKLAEFRRKNIGFIFQAYELIPSLTVRENVELPLVFQSISPRKRKKRALELLEMVGLPDKEKMFPSLLSGGQQQRVSIARSLITEPSVIFADEPTGNLDTKTEEEVIAILVELNKRMKTTFVIVTHELEVATRMERMIALKDGHLVASPPKPAEKPAETPVPQQPAEEPAAAAEEEPAAAGAGEGSQ